MFLVTLHEWFKPPFLLSEDGWRVGWKRNYVSSMILSIEENEWMLNSRYTVVINLGFILLGDSHIFLNASEVFRKYFFPFLFCISIFWNKIVWLCQRLWWKGINKNMCSSWLHSIKRPKISRCSSERNYQLGEQKCFKQTCHFWTVSGTSLQMKSFIFGFNTTAQHLMELI